MNVWFVMSLVRVALLLKLLHVQAVRQPDIYKVLSGQQSAKPHVQPTHIQILEHISVKPVLRLAITVQFQEQVVVLVV